MGISSTESTFNFDGVISTDNTVIQNLEMMCSAAGSFLTYDSSRGQWAVVINQAGNSVASFNDSNILGSISLTSTGLLDLHNSVRVNYPRDDLKDVRDFVRYEILSQDRLPNEPDSELTLEFDIFHDPVQADLLAITNLKQSRMDLVIKFQTKFGSIGLKPGEIVVVTIVIYGFDHKKFRITTVAESDSDDGNILLDITALEYSDDVYDLSDLSRFTRSDLNGISAPGEIGAPSTPTITVEALSARPHVVVTTLVPGNAIVERMELWYSTNNANFELVATATPIDGSGKFTLGTTITFEHVPPNTGDIFYRVRGGNQVTTGAFSATASGTFTPTQVTDAIGFDTEILDSDNNAILTELALSALLAALDGFLDGNTDMNDVFGEAFDSLFGPAFDTKFDESTGNTSSGVLLAAQYNINPLTLNANVELAPWTGGNAPYVTTDNLSFTVPTSGYINVSMFANFGNNTESSVDSMKSIYFGVFQGNTHGVGNAVVLPGTPANIDFYTGTSHATNNGQSLFDDLDCHFIGYVPAGTYHLEMAYHANAGTSCQFASTISQVGTNYWGNNQA